MSFFDYTGNRTATQSPSPAPAPGVSPILHIPNGNEAFDIADLLQPLEACADYADFATDRALRIPDFELREEFTGSAISTARWTNITRATVIGTEANANGTIKLLSAGVGSPSEISTCTLNLLGTKDFYYAARARVTTFSSSQIALGFSGLGYAWVANGASDTHWLAVINNVTVATSTTLADGTFHVFEIARVGGVVRFWIDGALIYSGASALSIADKLGAFGSNTGNDNETRIDSIRARIIGG